MGNLTAEKREELLVTSRELAITTLEDIAQLRAISDALLPTKTTTRHMSATLRKLLLNGDLAAVAAPRTGRVRIHAPRNADYREVRDMTYFLGGYTDPEKKSGSGCFMIVPKGTATPPRESQIWSDLSIDQFMAEPVACYQNVWALRRHVLEYVGVIAGGIHSGEPEKDYHHLLALIRTGARMSVKGDVINISFNPSAAIDGKDVDFPYDADSVDVVLHEILAMARYMVKSPDVLALETCIKTEFGIA